MARTSGLAAGFLRGVDRRIDAHTMVAGLGVPSTQASSSSESIPVSLACELNSRAINALDRARKLPSGDKRTVAMRRAAILGNAAEILAYFSAAKDRC
ncbi:hypothetical protein G6321_00009230 [Bradyrhizobium barranii subsp. barranii]|uniref:Uncharacterized protein n=2 Tax=Bradyrhizobium barranii subsp. barranii TaxID=2823807 RepID=A0A9X9YWJ9_9BRAD|nr:hypothetical protein [Bradyrhizobium barranii]UGX95304.1 hypothetical protein G6321_00009230 [Bradyrhizobium barranii subsp. barranii]